MASPMKVPHGKMGPLVSAWLSEYGAATPGTEILLGATAILGPLSEPEPDHCLRVLPNSAARRDKCGRLPGGPARTDRRGQP